MSDPSSRSGTTYTNSDLVAYVAKVHAPHDAALDRAFESPEKNGMPAIMVNPSEGKLVALLLRMVGARKVVEVGTLAGYSAIRIARALPDDGKLWTIEYDTRHAEIARANIAAAGVAGRVEVLVGKGVDLLPTIEAHGPFDAVFVDADKENYDRYGAWAAKNVRSGGLLLGDNANYFGRLLDDSAGAKAMRRFHEESRGSFDTVCAPTPDGLLIGIHT